MKTANLAIVFTDIQGFTERTSRQTLEQNQRLLQTHAKLLTPLFKAFGGRVIKSIGDAFLVTFESPTQAVLCGIAIQDRLWLHNRTATEDDRLEVRVAVNVGEVRLESNDVFGEPVNIAARVEALARAGEVYFTEAVYLAMNKAEVPAEEVGAFDLKGIPGRIRVFRVPPAPYRVEAASGPELPGEVAQPPFGNLGLSRVGEGTAVRAEALGGGAPSVPRATGRRRTGRVRLVAGGAALLATLALVLSRGSAVERAIDDVADATSSERPGRVERARGLIAAEPDAAARDYWTGRLQEAQGSLSRAVGAYRDAAHARNRDALERLVELLEHPECRVRAGAADALGELRIESARAELEALAERGGPGEGRDLPLIGCSSRRAAADALRRLSP